MTGNHGRWLGISAQYLHRGGGGDRGGDRYHPKIEAVAEKRLVHALLLHYHLDFEPPLPTLLLSHLGRGALWLAPSEAFGPILITRS